MVNPSLQDTAYCAPDSIVAVVGFTDPFSMTGLAQGLGFWTQVGRVERVPSVHVIVASPDIVKLFWQDIVYCSPDAIVSEAGWMLLFVTEGLSHPPEKFIFLLSWLIILRNIVHESWS